MMALPNTVCPLCGGPNACAPAAGGTLATPCWCTTVSIPAEVLARLPADQVRKSCVCKSCASAARGEDERPVAAR